MEDSKKYYTEAHTRHLEMIQDVISRMANNSNTLKRYSVVITASAVSFAKFANEPNILAAAAVLIAGMAFLDANYLRLERCFRDLFDEVRTSEWDVPPTFRVSKEECTRNFWCALFSYPVIVLYSLLILFIAGSLLILNGS